MLMLAEATEYGRWHWLAAPQSEDSMPLSSALVSAVGHPLPSFQTSDTSRGALAVDVIYRLKTSRVCIRITISRRAMRH